MYLKVEPINTTYLFCDSEFHAYAIIRPNDQIIRSDDRGGLPLHLRFGPGTHKQSGSTMRIRISSIQPN